VSGILNAQKHNTWESGKSFSLLHRLYRVAWGIVWAVFASWTPPQLHRRKEAEQRDKRHRE